MAFIQCTEEQAARFVEFMLQSGSWSRAPVGNWIAHRLTKTRPTTEEDPQHSILDVLVIHKNAKGIHSFDPLFEKAFTASIASQLREGLKGLVGQRVEEDMKPAVASAVSEALSGVLPESVKVLGSKVQPNGWVEMTITVPPELAEKLGLLP